jgi:hypothetical protein
MGTIGRASPYLWTSVSAPRCGIQATHSINHLRELRKYLIIKTPHVVWGLASKKHLGRNHHWREGILLLVPTQEKQMFLFKLHLTKLSFLDFCCDNGGPDGKDVYTGLDDWMMQQRHVSCFLVFPLCCVGLNLQDLRFVPTYFVAFLVCILSIISRTLLISGYFTLVE